MNTVESGHSTFSPFLPLCLLAVSLNIILGWQVTAGVQQYLGSLRLVDQQSVLANQAAQAESKLQGMMTDLLQLAKTDSEARAIVTKYRIKMNADKPDDRFSRATLPDEKPSLPAVDAVRQAPPPQAPAAAE
ncbi:MAG: hypothetical protein WCK89_03270 [bacterium]